MVPTKPLIIYNDLEYLCVIMIEVDDTKLNTVIRTKCVFNKIEYDILYVYGMEYGIVVPKLKHIVETINYDNVH